MTTAHPQRRTVMLLAVCCIAMAPLGWAMFYAVFRNVPGQDWVLFHTVAARYFAGDLHMITDPHALADEMNRTHRAWLPAPITDLHPWAYPPVTLLLAIAFGKLPYLTSWLAFVVTSFAAMAASLCLWQQRIQDRLMLLAGVALCPAVAYTIGAGQLSFLIAAIVLTGTALLRSRPFLAGMVLSLLCLKPQFAILIPIALLASQNWRAISGALTGGIAAILLSLAIVGAPPWIDWIKLATGSNQNLSGLIQVVRVYDQSIHTCLRTLGANETLAGIGQILAILLAASCVWITFMRPNPLAQKLIVLLCAMVFCAPHIGDYDGVLLAIAATLIALESRTRALRSAEAPLAAAVWLSTMFNPPALIAIFGMHLLTVISALTPVLTGALMILSIRPQNTCARAKTL